MATEQMSAAPSSVVVITGLSGAGKTTALHALADAGYYVVDNLPPTLAAATLRECSEGGIERIALGMDVRVGAFLDSLASAVESLRGLSAALTVLYLDAADDALVRRFSETRRPHPILATHKRSGAHIPTIQQGVQLERQRLAAIRNLATLVLDTSHLSVHELRRQLLEQFSPEERAGARMTTRVMSFGFKHGAPLDADLVFDVRFLDNPHFVPELRPLSGIDEPVRAFVLGNPDCVELLGHLMQLLRFALPRYAREGKSYLTIAVGCTGGRHRSVAITGELARRLQEDCGCEIAILHRDLVGSAMMSPPKAPDESTKRP